ncbi:hypothetical protein BC941DRAFT_415479 [Chlamydoabsidia padenii]|nr:hypothetical protein BC941DRAFT_415479 [Chlamydoabsidia padenii]
MTVEYSKQSRQDHSVLETCEQYKKTLTTLASDYWLVLKDVVIQLWQYMEFRILVYIFLSLSFIPFGIFLLFCTCLSSFIFFIAGGVWLFIGTIAFFVLLPFLIGSFGMAVVLVLTYQAYIFVTTSFVSNQHKEDDSGGDSSDTDDLVIYPNRK